MNQDMPVQQDTEQVLICKLSATIQRSYDSYWKEKNSL